MGASSKLDDNEPVIAAWEAYKETEDFRDTFRMMSRPDSGIGNCWAMFSEGWRAASDRLTPMLLRYIQAASRLTDGKYSDGDEAVKKELWQALHSLETEARDLINAWPLPSKPA